MSQIISVLAESVTTNLSLAVGLTDDYSEGRITGDVDVSLKDQDTRPIVNPSGYYLFLNLTESNQTVLIDGGEYYFDYEMDDVDLDELNELCPVVNITLKPTPSYPFPSSATLIRGCVLDSQNNGILGAALTVKHTDIKTETTARGEFVVYFRGMKEYEVVIEGKKKLLKIKGKNPVLIIEHPDYRNKQGKIWKKDVTVEVEEGMTASHSITYP